MACWSSFTEISDWTFPSFLTQEIVTCVNLDWVSMAESCKLFLSILEFGGFWGPKIFLQELKGVIEIVANCESREERCHRDCSKSLIWKRENILKRGKTGCHWLKISLLFACIDYIWKQVCIKWGKVLPSGFVWALWIFSIQYMMANQWLDFHQGVFGQSRDCKICNWWLPSFLSYTGNYLKFSHYLPSSHHQIQKLKFRKGLVIKQRIILDKNWLVLTIEIMKEKILCLQHVNLFLKSIDYIGSEHDMHDL